MLDMALGNVLGDADIQPDAAQHPRHRHRRQQLGWIAMFQFGPSPHRGVGQIQRRFGRQFGEDKLAARFQRPRQPVQDRFGSSVQERLQRQAMMMAFGERTRGSSGPRP